MTRFPDEYPAALYDGREVEIAPDIAPEWWCECYTLHAVDIDSGSGVCLQWDEVEPLTRAARDVVACARAWYPK